MTLWIVGVIETLFRGFTKAMGNGNQDPEPEDQWAKMKHFE